MNSIDFEKYIPEYARGIDLLVGPFVASCHWAIGQESIRSDFEKETKKAYAIPSSHIDAMIDNATGASKDYIESFIEWWAKGYWKGIEND